MFRRLSRFLVPAPTGPEVGMEIRLFRMACLAAAGLGLFVVLPANHVQGLPLSLNLAVLVFSLLAYALYRLSLRGRHALKTFSGLLALLLNLSWFLNAGSQGSIGMFLFSGVLVPFIFFKGRSRWLFLGAFLLNGLGLLWVEHLRPALVVPYPHPHDRLWDLMISFVAATIASVVSLWVVLSSFDAERARLTAVNARLEQSLAEIRTLRGLLPICGWCKKIRNDEGLWTQVEQYLAEHADVSFTHGMCPECSKAHFPGRPGQPEEAPPGEA